MGHPWDLFTTICMGVSWGQVKALKQHGKELEDRWERVAADVPCKTKGQCMKRFKALRSTFRAQQASS